MPRDARTILPRRTGSRRALQPEAWDPARWPADAACAEEGVRLAYHAVGQPPPRIVWCRSPIELAAAWARAVAGGRPGANIKCVLFDRPYDEGKSRIGSALRDARQAHELLTHDRGRAIGAAVAEVVVAVAGTIRPRLLPWLCRTRRHLLRADRRPVFATSGCGPAGLHAAGRLAYMEALDRGTTDALEALRSIGENAGWLVPHARTCWLSARPDLVRTDAEDRLHCTSGPALRYRDGWSRFAWKGVIVPAWVIERPQDITLDWIDAQIDAPVRHAMIDILTAERFISEGGAHPIARDARGVLWSRTWTHRGTVIDRWRAVECSAASGSRRIVQAVPEDMQTPEAALDWLLGPPTSDARDGSLRREAD